MVNIDFYQLENQFSNRVELLINRWLANTEDHGQI